MTEKPVKISVLAEQSGVSIKTIHRWIKSGYAKTGKRLAAERQGWQYFVNPSTFKTFKHRIHQ